MFEAATSAPYLQEMCVPLYLQLTSKQGMTGHHSRHQTDGV